MNYFISDLHFGHANIIKLCKRPFKDVDEMNEVLISNWNKRVHKNDNVYIVGDLFFRMAGDVDSVLTRLKGNKYLIKGNHDKTWIKKVDLAKYFKFVGDIYTFNDGQRKLTLCHYPMMDFEGAYLIYGHIHANKDDFYWDLLKTMDNALNAGADIHDFTPVTFDELVVNNLKFKQND